MFGTTCLWPIKVGVFRFHILLLSEKGLFLNSVHWTDYTAVYFQNSLLKSHLWKLSKGPVGNEVKIITFSFIYLKIWPGDDTKISYSWLISKKESPASMLAVCPMDSSISVEVVFQEQRYDNACAWWKVHTPTATGDAHAKFQQE